MGGKFELAEVISAACKVPGVKINRDEFLMKEFGAPKYNSVKNMIIKNGPGGAGISSDDIEKHAKGVINFETTKVTALAAAAGVPGGLAMIATVPADVAQFYAHVLRVIQKLMYLYGWEDIGAMDESTKNLLILFLGAMSGVQAAQKAIADLCASAAAKATKTIAAKALTKTTLFPIVKKVCQQLGVRMTKEVFAKGVAKAIPIIGAVASGGITLATFKPMSNRLLKVLKDNS